jgi:hypothetical protein
LPISSPESSLLIDLFVSISDHRMDILPCMRAPGQRAWTFGLADTIRLEGAHGDEIVRSFLIHDECSVVWTAGEDGIIKAWKMAPEPQPHMEHEGFVGQAASATTKQELVGRPRKRNAADRAKTRKLFRPY